MHQTLTCTPDLTRARDGACFGLTKQRDPADSLSLLRYRGDTSATTSRCNAGSQAIKTQAMAKYPSRDELYQLFSNLASTDKADSFFERVSPDVDWTVMGTHPLAGRYNSLQVFQEDTFARLAKIMKPPGLAMGVRNVIGGGEPWATVELVLNGVCKNGFVFDNCYAWCVRFNEKGVIVEVRAYLDSWMVRQAIIENEVPSNRAPVPQAKELPKPF